MSASEVWQATIFNYLQKLNLNLGVLFVKSVGRIDIGHAIPEKDAIEAVFQLCKRKRTAGGNDATGTKFAAKKPKLDTSSDSSDSDSHDGKAEKEGKKAAASAPVAATAKQQASATKTLKMQSSTAKQQPSTTKAAIVLDSDSDSDSNDSDLLPTSKVNPKQPAPAMVKKTITKSISSDSDSDSDDYANKRPVTVAQRSTVLQGAISSASTPKNASAALTASQKNTLVSRSPMGAQKAATKPTAAAPLSSCSDSDSDSEFEKPKSAPKPTVPQPAAKAKGVSANTNTNTKTPAGAVTTALLTASTSSSDSSDSDCRFEAVTKPVATTVSKVTKGNNAPIPIKAPAVKQKPVSVDSYSSSSSDEPIITGLPVSKATPGLTQSVKSKKTLYKAEADSDEDSSSSSDEDASIKPIAARNEPPPTAAAKQKPATTATVKPKPSAAVAKKPTDTSSDSESDYEPAKVKPDAVSVKKDVPPKWVTGAGIAQEVEMESSSESDKPAEITQPNLGNRGGRGGRGGARGGAAACYRCGEAGHLAKFCTSPAKNASATSPRKSCYNCGEEGHVSYNCPQQSSSSRGGARGRASPVGAGVQQRGRGRGRGAGFSSSRSIPAGASPNKVTKFNDDD